MPFVSNRQSVAKVQRSSTDKKIREWYNIGVFASFRVDPRSDLTDLVGERLRWNCLKNCIYIIAPFGRLVRRIGSMDAVFHFNNADRRNYNFSNRMLFSQ